MTDGRQLIVPHGIKDAEGEGFGYEVVDLVSGDPAESMGFVNFGELATNEPFSSSPDRRLGSGRPWGYSDRAVTCPAAVRTSSSTSSPVLSCGFRTGKSQ